MLPQRQEGLLLLLLLESDKRILIKLLIKLAGIINAAGLRARLQEL